MELRDIEIFLTLAEELHFGRTAARLHVTPARVSQSIKQQERRIGGVLFARSSRAVRLTPLGEQLRADLSPVFHGLRDSVERARLKAQGVTDVLRVGMLPTLAHDLRPFWEAFRQRNPASGLQIRSAGFTEPFAPLRAGQFDILVAWLPVEEPDLTVGPVIYTEPRMMAFAAGHPLAGEATVSLEILGNDQETVTAQPFVPDYWEDAYVPFETPSGRPIDRRTQVTTWDDMLMLAATGRAVFPTLGHVTRYYPRPDVSYVPIHDAPRIRWGLIWRTESRLVQAFAQVVRDLGTLHLP